VPRACSHRPHTGADLLEGNTDAHLRNHAFLHQAGALALSPVYAAAPAIVAACRARTGQLRRTASDDEAG
jgi:HipA-like C-terminal domain